MKKVFLIAALTVFIWGCAKKSISLASGSSITPNGGSVINKTSAAATPAVAVKSETVATSSNVAVATVPSTPSGTRTPVEGAVAKSPEMLGQATYNTKCGKCHGLKVTADFTADRWVSIMQVMAPKARLDDTEKANVLAYVKANAKR